ncbi:MAG: host attachment protein [Desulfonatronovibrionaceae bacterium]
METIWILAADSGRARIFTTSRKDVLERETHSVVHPEGRQAGKDIIQDRPGRSINPSKGKSRVTFEPSSDPRKHEVRKFAADVAEIINQGALDNKYQGLYILAPPEFLGMLRNELEPAAEKRIRAEMDKNVTRLKKEEIREHLPEFL